MIVMVTGGAGYIGSHTVRQLRKAGCRVLVYDNLSRGHKKAVIDFPLVEGDTADIHKLSYTLRKYQVNAVMHFADKSLVGKSVGQPNLYYRNNVMGGLTLLEAIVNSKVRYFIYSSSAAVYGETDQVPISESLPLRPVNPYGATKVVIERALPYFDQAYGVKSVSLRYFNAAGAAPEGGIGEDHNPETHLIPLILHTVLGKKEKITVFGSDYPTPDGSAIRDYIHVNDLAKAHVLALKALVDGLPTGAYNLGNEKGYSVLQVIQAAEKVVGCHIPYEIGPRRPGDPAVLVASSEKAKLELHWKPDYEVLERIIETAWEWHKTHPDGYR